MSASAACLLGFGGRLRDARKSRGLSQSEFANLGGVSRATLHLYESDVRRPDVEFMARLYAAGFDTHGLLTGNPSLLDPWPADRVLEAFDRLEAFEKAHSTKLSSEDRRRLFLMLCLEAKMPKLSGAA
jgi:transcriptional regulator with XRE-family HTH domain